MIKTKNILALSLLFTVIVLYRISTTLPNTLTIDYTSITNIPWADAVGWVTGAENIQEGIKMVDFPSRRAIYPAFLSLIFFSTGGTYDAAIITQCILYSAAILICFLLLRAENAKYSVAFFLACITLWLPITQSLFLTENLGSILLIISFGFLWKGVHQKCSSNYTIGLFLLSLAFFTRPWAIGCLLTLPLLAFSGSANINNKVRSYFFFLTAIFAGFSINWIVTSLFATPGTASNYPQTLYGLVSHSLNWRSSSVDPVISKYMQANIAPLELNTIIYKRCLEIFINNPWLFLQSVLDTYSDYIHHLTGPFNTSIYLYPLFILFFAIFLRFKPQKLSWHSYLVVPIFFLLAFLNLQKYLFLFLLIYGILFAFIKRRSNIGGFIILYLFGILISLPIVGIDGGDRVKIASDIFLFFLAAFGFQQIILPTKELEEAGFINNKLNLTAACLTFTISLVVFVCLPWTIRLIAPLKTTDNLSSITPEQVSSQLNLPQLPLSTIDLEKINRNWPSPSYETVNDKTVLITIKYTARDSIFFKEKDGVQQRPFEFWPMGIISPPTARTIHTRSWCIFPRTSPLTLKQFDNKNILIVGKLIGKPRNWKYDTGYSIIVKYIGSSIKDGGVNWTSLEDNNKQFHAY